MKKRITKEKNKKENAKTLGAVHTSSLVKGKKAEGKETIKKANKINKKNNTTNVSSINSNINRNIGSICA